VNESVTPSATDERWRPVVGFEGFYEVSEFGRVQSLPRKTATGIRGGQILKPWLTTTGYLAVTLCKHNVRYRRTIHRLVGEAFIGPLPPGMHTRHGQNGSGDPGLANICYGTAAENEADKVRDGTSNRGERNGCARLTRALVEEIRSRYAAGESGGLLALEYGLSSSHVGELAQAAWGFEPVVRVAQGHMRGERQPNAKLTEEIVRECRRRRSEGATYAALARSFGVTKAVMREAVIGITWKHVA